MINGYITIREAAEKWELQVRRVQTLCAQGRVPGAAKFGSVWAIPEGTERPSDLRETTGEYKDWRKKYPSARKNAPDPPKKKCTEIRQIPMESDPDNQIE